MSVIERRLSTGGASAAPTADYTLIGGERWYVVHTQSQRETTAQAQLGQQGFRSFMPRYEKTVRHARKLTRTRAPLFPRYVFVILDLDRHPWHSVNGTIGVVSLLMSHERPLAAPSGVVEALISMSSHDKEQLFLPTLTPGQKVRLVAGPFAEQLGVVEQLDDRGRVRVLLEMMGAWYPVRVPSGDVLPVD
jgi:transcriptional antiterminator RfaH